MPPSDARPGDTAPSGRGGLGGYPVNLLVAGRRCLVVGAGRIAARKVEALLDAGARVVVVAPELGSEVVAWRDAGRLEAIERAFADTDLDGAWLVTVATGDPESSAAVFTAAERRGIWCNAADDPEHCSVTLMSVVRQGDLVVTIGTGGRSPALAAYLKDHVAQEMGPEWAELLEMLSEARERVRAGGVSSETVDWRRALDSGMLELIRAGRRAEAKELLEACLSSSSD
jgi:siroheme synthase-like protein